MSDQAGPDTPAEELARAGPAVDGSPPSDVDIVRASICDPSHLGTLRPLRRRHPALRQRPAGQRPGRRCDRREGQHRERTTGRADRTPRPPGQATDIQLLGGCHRHCGAPDERLSSRSVTCGPCPGSIRDGVAERLDRGLESACSAMAGPHPAGTFAGGFSCLVTGLAETPAAAAAAHLISNSRSTVSGSALRWCCA